MAPKKVTKKPATKKSASKTNPVEKLIQDRRDFFTSIQTRIQNLPESATLPSSVADEIRNYSRSQGSEKGMMKAVDCSVGQLNGLLSFLLQAPHLMCATLEGLIQKYLASLVIREELGLREDPLAKLSYNERVVHKIRKYVKEHLSTFLVDLPPEASKTDRSLEDMRKDLEKLFPTDNPFTFLFDTYIPAFYIKSWLAHTDFISPQGKLDVRRAVHSFIQDHRFHLLKDLLEKEGFTPKSAHDWELVVGQEYFERYPIQFWKHTKWPEFEAINENLKKFSLSVSDYFRLLHEKQESAEIIRVEEKKTKGKKKSLVVLQKGTKKDKTAHLRYSVPKNLLRMPTEKDKAVNLRIRSDLEGFVSHLVMPLDGQKNEFVGAEFNWEYFYPSDDFYKERVRSSSTFKDNTVLIVSNLYDPPKTFTLRVAYLFKDGRVVPQTKKMYEEEQAYLDEQTGIQLPKLKDYLLYSPIENLSLEDVDRIREKLRNDLSTVLQQLYTKKLDTDTIASALESCFLRCKNLYEYLSKMAQVFLVVHPRYNFFSIFPEMKERLNLFYYKLPTFGEITLPLLFPRIEQLDEELQETFFKWKESTQVEFIQESLLYLLRERYRFIRIPIQSVSHSTAPLSLYDTNRDTNYLLLMPYQDTMLNLSDIASMKKNDEILVGSKPVPNHVLEGVIRFMEAGRLRLRTGAYLEDTGFELNTEENIGIGIETPMVSVQTTAIQDTSLPGFKENAYTYLDHLMSLA